LQSNQGTINYSAEVREPQTGIIFLKKPGKLAGSFVSSSLSNADNKLGDCEFPDAAKEAQSLRHHPHVVHL